MWRCAHSGYVARRSWSQCTDPCTWRRNFAPAHFVRRRVWGDIKISKVGGHKINVSLLPPLCSMIGGFPPPRPHAPSQSLFTLDSRRFPLFPVHLVKHLSVIFCTSSCMACAAISERNCGEEKQNMSRGRNTALHPKFPTLNDAKKQLEKTDYMPALILNHVSLYQSSSISP